MHVCTIFFVDFRGILSEDWHEVICVFDSSWTYMEHWEMLASLCYIDICAAVVTVTHHNGHLQGQRQTWKK